MARVIIRNSQAVVNPQASRSISLQVTESNLMLLERRKSKRVARRGQDRVHLEVLSTQSGGLETLLLLGAGSSVGQPEQEKIRVEKPLEARVRAVHRVMLQQKPIWTTP